MSPLSQQYAQTFDDNAALDWRSWFEDDTPQEQLDLLDDLEVSGDVAIALIEAGETNWQHPGWWPDVHREVVWWIQDGKAERSRFVACWLLESCPIESARAFLIAVVEGDVPESMANHGCSWPAGAEFYLQTLQWNMVPYAEGEALRRDWVLAQHMHRRGLGKVYHQPSS